MNPKEKLAALIKAAREVAEKAKGENRALTPEEQTDLDGKMAEINQLKADIAVGEKSAATLAALDQMAAEIPGDAKPGGDERPAKSLGEHFVKHAHARMIETKGQSNVTVGAPEFVPSKAATDSHAVGGWTDGVPYLTDFDRTGVQHKEEMQWERTRVVLKRASRAPSRVSRAS